MFTKRERGESGHPGLVSNHGRKDVRFLSLSMMLAVSLVCMSFIMFTYVPSNIQFIESFYHENLILSNVFPVSVEMIIQFFSYFY